MTPDTYLICFECQHAFTAQELLTLANAEVRKLANKPSWGFFNEGFGEPNEAYIPYVDPEDIRVCPLCTHDLW